MDGTERRVLGLSRCSLPLSPHAEVDAVNDPVTAAERSYGVAAHLAPLAWGGVIPVLGGFLVPLLVWWWMRESGFVVRHARASINFQLSMTVHYALAFGYVFVSVSFGMLLLGLAMIFETVSIMRAARRAKAGEHYQYRLCLEFVKESSQ